MGHRKTYIRSAREATLYAGGKALLGADGSGAPSAAAALLGRARGRLAFATACAALLAFAALLSSAATPFSPPAALAGTVTGERPFLFAFDGHDATAGAFTKPRSIAVDNSTGDVYVANDGYPEGGFISKFNAEGVAQDFSATGTSSLYGSVEFPLENGLSTAVDNSGGASQGDLLVSQYGGTELRAFAPTGSLLWALFPEHQAGGIAVDHSGYPWLIFEFDGPLTQYANTGAPPAPTGCTIKAAEATGDNLALDANGNVYSYGKKYTKTGACSFTQSTLDPSARSVYADQSSPTGHVFTVDQHSFNEYDPSGALVKSYGGEGEYIRDGRSIAYSPTRDWVYVSQYQWGGFGSNEPRQVIAVFGPPTGGTVPTVTENAAPSSVGVSTAHFSGKVNPENVAATAHFEWRKSGESWASAAMRQSSPPAALPVSNTEEPLSYDTDELRGNTTYEVRLVTTNNSGKLHAFSAEVKEFTTPKATEPPEVIVKPANPIGTTTATANAEINPEGDTAEWRLELQPACSGAWTEEPLQQIAHGTSSPVSVHYDLTGLLPNERYCVRFVATNSDDTTTRPESTDPPAEFTTLPVPPDQVVTAFAAPRLDTSARLNGYANPEGSDLTYRFDYRKDGDLTWIPLPSREDTSKERKTIVVGEELTELSPDTTYDYRFVAADHCHPKTEPEALCSVEGEAETFTTRTSAEIVALDPPSCPNAGLRAAQRSASYLPQCRAFELVNQPDKGNQNVSARVADETAPLRADGERAVWNVAGGAPGGNTGSGAAFLATRTPAGWKSRALVPPASQQVEPEEGSYGLAATTPDFTSFIFMAGDQIGFCGHTFLRLDAAQHQEVLGPRYSYAQCPSNLELTDDAAHLLRIYTRQEEEPRGEERLQDLGTGVPQTVGLLPGGFSGAASEGGGAGKQWRPGYNRMATTDASRVYFAIHPNGSSCGADAPWQIFERNREANAGAGETLEVVPPDRSNAMIRATTDGRSLYFLTALALDPADHNTHSDVYRWDEEAKADTCLTCGIENEAGETIADANLVTYNGGEEPVLVSDDFSHLYFQSESKLAPQATPGQVNLYALDLGARRLHFVATPNSAGAEDPLNPDQAALSTDGDVLVFRTYGEGVGSNRELTADRLAPSCPSPSAGGLPRPCEELFRYDDRDQSLECLSCLRGGLTTASVGSIAGYMGGIEGDFRLSADGETVAFVTAQKLVPQDVDDGPDLYQWRAGVQHLLTDGVTGFGQTQGAALRLWAIGASGRDILFSVDRPGLTGFEADGFANLYDARSGGGFMPPSPPVHCSEESCQGPLQAAPALEQPASTGTSRGNVVEPPLCRKPRVRRHGRCVKAHHKHRRHRRPAHAKHRRAK